MLLFDSIYHADRNAQYQSNLYHHMQYCMFDYKFDLLLSGNHEDKRYEEEFFKFCFVVLLFPIPYILDILLSESI